MIEKTIEDELKRLSRRIEELSKSVDLMYKDRDLLEDVVLRLTTVEQALHSNREHQTEVAKDIKADVLKIDYSVQDRVENIKNIVDSKEIIMVKESVFKKIQKLLLKKERK